MSSVRYIYTVLSFQAENKRKEKQMFFGVVTVALALSAFTLLARADPYGAIAVYLETNSNGCRVGSGSAWNYSGQWEAQLQAMQQCNKQSNRCFDAVWF